jgi:L-asparaginase
MQVSSTKSLQKLVVLGTGGTIAGTAAQAGDNVGYTAAQVGVQALLDGVPGLSGVLGGRTLQAEQVAQIDSKDMSFDVWQQLALRVTHHLAQPDVRGVVITHGTDTLEETAFFLHTVLAPAILASKPVVLVCAMRPASSLAPDGPQNMMDAVAVALTPGARGVVAVCAGTIHGAVDVQKIHTYRVDAFSSRDLGPLGFVEEGVVRLARNWPVAHVNSEELAMEVIATSNSLPRVEIVMNYAGASGAIVDALMMPAAVASSDWAPLRGLVVAATGNGSIHRDLEAALIRAQTTGVRVVRATRCANGRVLPAPGQSIPDSKGLSPVKARIALMLELLAS